VHTQPQLAEPDGRRGYDAFDQPLLWDGHRDRTARGALGAPLRSAPRTSEEVPPRTSRAACVAEVLPPARASSSAPTRPACAGCSGARGSTAVSRRPTRGRRP
jgi:hypothetical protein